MATGGLLSSLFSLCCGLLCCLIVLAAIIGGITFLLKRNKGTDVEAGNPETPEVKDSEEEASEDETTHKVEGALTEGTAASQTDASAVEPEVAKAAPVGESGGQAPRVNPKAAGQTIIAFDDDDEDF